MAQNIERMMAFIDSYNTFRSAERGRRIKRMAGFLNTFSESQQTLFGHGVATFNIFNLLRISNDEVKHSSFLAWLLNAKENHRQGNIFFPEFLHACDIDIPHGVLSRYHVWTEFHRMESRIDILVYRKAEFLIYIENKVGSVEVENQLAREFRDMRRLGSELGISQERQFAVFLTPDGRQPLTGNPRCWWTLSYQKLRESFEPLMSQITSDKVRVTLKDWLEVISNFGGV